MEILLCLLSKKIDMKFAATGILLHSQFFY